ncbi:CsbD family protein [Burkholderia stagnalis]
MDRNRIEGRLKQVKGSVKEALGKVTGDRRTEAEGVAEQQAGKVQEKTGEATDAARAGQYAGSSSSGKSSKKVAPASGKL